jgi:hypothetical protein
MMYVAPYLHLNEKNQKIINNILGVIKLYNRHHPNKRVDLTQVLNQ